MSGEFARDLIAMEAAELNGVCLDLTLSSDTGETLATLKDRPLEIVETLPDINEVNLHTPFFSLTDGRIHVAYESSGGLWGRHKRDWVSIKFSKY